MIYLLDTDMIIFLARGSKSTRPKAERQRAQKVAEHCQRAQADSDLVGLSAITVSELEFGARYGGRYDAEIAVVRKLITPFELFDYDAIVCPEHYGRVRHALDRSGTTIGAMDLLIAAHALALGATLVSNNQQHFSRVAGLTTENWSRSAD